MKSHPLLKPIAAACLLAILLSVGSKEARLMFYEDFSSFRSGFPEVYEKKSGEIIEENGSKFLRLKNGNPVPNLHSQVRGQKGKYLIRTRVRIPEWSRTGAISFYMHSIDGEKRAHDYILCSIMRDKVVFGAKSVTSKDDKKGEPPKVPVFTIDDPNFLFLRNKLTELKANVWYNVELEVFPEKLVVKFAEEGKELQPIVEKAIALGNTRPDVSVSLPTDFDSLIFQLLD